MAAYNSSLPTITSCIRHAQTTQFRQMNVKIKHKILGQPIEFLCFGLLCCLQLQPANCQQAQQMQMLKAQT